MDFTQNLGLYRWILLLLTTFGHKTKSMRAKISFLTISCFTIFYVFYKSKVWNYYLTTKYLSNRFLSSWNACSREVKLIFRPSVSRDFSEDGKEEFFRIQRLFFDYFSFEALFSIWKREISLFDLSVWQITNKEILILNFSNICSAYGPKNLWKFECNAYIAEKSSRSQ